MPSAILLSLVLSAPGAARRAMPPPLDIAALERPRVLAAAARFLDEDPRTVTAARSPRSAGGPHDFFSEGDYWWPDPRNPDGPYVQRDGMTNPDNFVEHRRALMRLSVQVPTLAAAWRLTGDARYAAAAGPHLRAWFLDPATRMAPHLRYAQAIHGITTGRPQGVIDTLHLVEVARAIEALDLSPALSAPEREGVRGWFRDYLAWLTTDENALKERDAKNNHATCWLLQVAAFARLVGDQERMAWARERFKTVIVPGQVAADGSFPEELRRTKPYGYSLFNLEAMAGVAQTLSTKDDDLWTFALPDGRGLRRALAYMVPYIRDKKAWPKPPDVMYDAEWPMRQASLLFGGLALGQPEYIALWKTLPADSNVEEVVRNFFIRQPVLWLEPTAERGGAAKRRRVARGVSGGAATAHRGDAGVPPLTK
jgi:Alginate lyase